MRGNPIARRPPRAAKSRDRDLVVTGSVSAQRAMDHPAVLEQFERALRRRRRHRVAVLVPCAQEKPYRVSRSHRLAYLPAVEGKSVDVLVVSEPMGIFPYEWSDEYPNTAYEFDPKHVRGSVREQLVERIAVWLKRRGVHYDRIDMALPAHHLKMVVDASEEIDGLNLRDLSISQCRAEGACPPSDMRATAHSYRDYLRRKIRG